VGKKQLGTNLPSLRFKNDCTVRACVEVVKKVLHPNAILVGRETQKIPGDPNRETVLGHHLKKTSPGKGFSVVINEVDGGG